MSLKNIIITSSINSYPTLSYGQRTYLASNNNESFPIETISGSDGKSWPNFVDGTNYTDNLYVNVTQSWSGSNITPLGYVPYIHSNNEEFFNGEFSGSIQQILKDNLNDYNCEFLLTANTVAFNYVPIQFETIFDSGSMVYTQDYRNIFFDSNAAPLNGEILFHNLVTINYITIFPFPPSPVPTFSANYMKIARIDDNGNDNSISLQELKNLKIKYNILGTDYWLNYKVINIVEYPTYYFYETIFSSFPGYPSTVLDTSYPTDHTFLATNASSIIIAPSNITNLTTNWIEVTDNANDFNTSTGKYTPLDTPSYTVNFTASGYFTPHPAVPGTIPFQTIDLGLGYLPSWGGSFPISITQFNFDISSSNQLCTITGSFNLIGNTPYYLYVYEGTGLAASVTNLTWKFDQSVSPSISINDCILDPYLLETFNYSDCDVLMNNANLNDISYYAKKVLYENGGPVPSNFQQIVSGSAESAELNDYLYTSNANRLPRYTGVRSESPDINLNSTFGGYGVLPNVEQLQTYFAYFDFLQPTSCEVFGKAAAHVRYLIDKDGNIQIPSLSGSSYYPNLIDNFEIDKYTELYVETENGDKEYLGLKKIIKPGVFPRAILYSQNCTSSVINPNIIFSNIPNAVPIVLWKSTLRNDGGGQFVQNGTLATPKFTYSTVIDSSNVTKVDLGSGNYALRININDPSVSISWTLYIEGDCDEGFPGTSQSNTQYLSFYIERSIDNGASWTTIKQYDASFPKNQITRFSFTSNLEPAQEGYLYRARGGKGYYGPFDITFQSSCYFKLNQSPAPTGLTVNYSPSTNQSNPYSVYWVTGSSPIPTNVITSSQLVPFWNPDSPSRQSGSNNSGYGALLPFTIQKGDQFRFEADENQTYMVKEAYTTNTNIIPTDLNDYNVYSGFTQNPDGTLTSNNLSFGYAYSNNTIYFPSYITSYNITLQISNGVAGEQIGVLLGNELSDSAMQVITTSAGTNTYSITVTPNQYDNAGPPLSRVRLIYGDDGTGFGPGGSFSGTIDFISCPGNDILAVEFYKDIAIGTKINSFLIRRLQINPNYVLLDTAPVSGSGYLFPEYSTDNLKQNFDNIIVNLKERGLI